jgi:arylsulfatase A-like enzyme
MLLVADCLRYDSAGPNYLAGFPWDRFERHYAVGPVSDVNFVTILTGVPPSETGVRYMVDTEWDCPWPTLPQVFRQHGYDTFGSGWHWRYQERGCQHWHGIGPNTPGQEQTDALWAWLGKGPEKRAKPWFAFIRTVDCHHEYTGGSYASAVRYTEGLFDALIGRVLAEHPETAIIVTGDHGEDLMEHGIPMHAGGLWDSIVHVPLLALPPDASEGARRHGLTQHTQLFDAILSLAGIEGYEAADLYPLHPQEMVYFDCEGKLPEMVRQVGLTTVDYKYWQQISIAGETAEYLYDLRVDPSEKHNLAHLQRRRVDGFASFWSHRAWLFLQTALRRLDRNALLNMARREFHKRFAEDLDYTEAEATAMHRVLEGLGYVP